MSGYGGAMDGDDIDLALLETEGDLCLIHPFGIPHTLESHFEEGKR